MTLFSFSAAADALEDLLDHERRLVLSGQIDGLLRISQEKERLLKRLPSAGDPEDVVDRLREKAARNQELLKAAALGIKSAAERVDSFRKPPQKLTTYGRDGAAVDLKHPPATGTRGVNRQA